MLFRELSGGNSLGWRVAALFSLAVCTPDSLAQGTAFTYQGRLNDGANPAGGIYDLRFAIYDAASLGTQRGNSLTNLAAAVSNGLFAVTLDFGNQFPGADRWLEIAVRTNGAIFFTPLVPRQRLAAVPYAITAGNLTGNISTAQLPVSVVTNGAKGVSISGTFTGDGAGLTNAAGWVTRTNLVPYDNTNALYVTGETQYGWNGIYTYIGSGYWTNAALAATVGGDVLAGDFGLWTNKTAFENSYNNLDNGGGYGASVLVGDYFHLPASDWFTWDDTSTFYPIHVSFGTNYFPAATSLAGQIIAGNGGGISNVVAAGLIPNSGGSRNRFTNAIFYDATHTASYILVTNRAFQLPVAGQSNPLCLYSVVDPATLQLSSIGFLDGATAYSPYARFAGFNWFPHHTDTEMEMTIDSPGSLALGWANESQPGVALQPNRSLQIGINPSEYGRLENIYIQGNFNSYANPNMGYAIPLSFNSAYKSNGINVNQLMTLWAHATTTNGESRLTLYDNWDQSATADLKSHNFSKSAVRAEFITQSANGTGGLDVYGRLWSTNFAGSGAGLTNLNAGKLTGTLPVTNLPGLTTNVVVTGATFYVTNGLIMRITKP